MLDLASYLHSEVALFNVCGMSNNHLVTELFSCVTKALAQFSTTFRGLLSTYNSPRNIA